MKPPKFLYRYEPPEVNRLEYLERRWLWFSRPRHFDDLLDCNIRVDEPVSNKSAEAVYSLISKSQPDKKRWDEYYLVSGTPTASTTQKIQEASNFVFDFWRGRAKNVYGILCLSEQPDVPLLWSKYAQNHTGFCLEFNTSYWPFEKALKVEYYKEVPTFPLDSILRGEQNVIETIITTKSECWTCQREWRIALPKGDTPYGYDINALTAVYLGINVNPQVKERIVSALKDLHTKLYQMIEGQTESSLIYEPIA